MDIKNFFNGVIKEFFKEKKHYIYGNSLNESIKLNGFSIKKENDIKCETTFFNTDGILTERKEEVENKGGIIVFSVDVNAVKQSENVLKNWFLRKVKTYQNIFQKKEKISKIIKQNEEVFGLTIGKFVTGRYRGTTGELYDESSLSIEIIGVTTEILDKVAMDVCKEFNQESVLVKNYDDNKIYFIYAE